MNRLTVLTMTVRAMKILAMTLVLLLCPGLLLAQHGGHGGGGRPGATGAGVGNDSSLTDFNHALAVQATPDQTSRFKELAKSTEDARKLAQDLAKLSASADIPADLSQRTAALKSAVEDAQGGSQDFMKSFSKSQKAGLKELAKKLEKVDSEVGKQWKVLEKQLGESKADVKGIAGTADTLEKTLGDFQSQQTNLGKEMGIQPPAASGS
jgi:hypothetical protein